MRNRIPTITTRHLGAGLLALATFVSVAPRIFAAQPAPDPTHAAHVASGSMPPDAPKGDPALAQQISQLRARVAQLEASLTKHAASMPSAPASAAMPGMSTGATPPPPMPGMGAAAPAGGSMNMMGMMDKMMGMMDKMMSMDDDKMKMPAMGGGSAMPPTAPAAPMSGGMGDDKKEMAGMMGMMDMDMMGMGGGSGAMTHSALPGFPGSSHLYHMGATGFFLDHSQHIALTTEQQGALNKAREQALLAKGTADRAIKQAEQELWTLTAADQPDTTAIQAKITAIGKLNGDQRLAFIRAVGDATKLLTDEQRKSLTGFAPPAPAKAMAAPAAADPMAGGMKHM